MGGVDEGRASGETCHFQGYLSSTGQGSGRTESVLEASHQQSQAVLQDSETGRSGGGNSGSRQASHSFVTVS